MATFEGRISFDYYARNVADKKALDELLDGLIDLLARRSNDLEGVIWDNVDWTAEQTGDTCVECDADLDNWDNNPFMRYCDKCEETK